MQFRSQIISSYTLITPEIPVNSTLFHYLLPKFYIVRWCLQKTHLAFSFIPVPAHPLSSFNSNFVYFLLQIYTIRNHLIKTYAGKRNTNILLFPADIVWLYRKSIMLCFLKTDVRFWFWIKASLILGILILSISQIMRNICWIKIIQWFLQNWHMLLEII